MFAPVVIVTVAQLGIFLTVQDIGGKGYATEATCTARLEEIVGKLTAMKAIAPVGFEIVASKCKPQK